MDFDDIKKAREQPQPKPTPAPVRPAVASRREPAPTPTRLSKVNLTLYIKRIQNLPKKILLISGVILVVIITVVIIIAAQPKGDQPRYSTVTPDGKSISSLGGWKRVSPPEATPVFAFIDTLDDITINVSQQKLPDDFKQSPEKSLEELAAKFYATNKIDGTDAFIGTSAKGPQSVLFIKNDTLVMIKSQKEIPDQSWAEYIRNLR